MGEFLDFITDLEPMWEDPNEFDWIRSKDIDVDKKRRNPFELNRFPGLKMVRGTNFTSLEKKT